MKKHLVNEEINVSDLTVIDSEKNNLGKMSLNNALKLADKEELDLVLFNESPAIAKIIDYNKFLYEENKKNKKQKVISNKEVQFGLKIAKHDLEIKTKKINSFLNKKHNVLIKIQLKGREMQSPEQGFDLMSRIIEQIEIKETIDSKPELKGRNITLFVRAK